eukprot:53290_1
MSLLTGSKTNELPPTNVTEQPISNIANFLLSGTAAVISKTTSAPIERVKLLIQNQNELIKSNRLLHPYKSAMDCIKQIFINEGIKSFWRGNLTNCIRYFNYQALNFTLKEKIKYKFHEYSLISNNHRDLTNILFTHIIIGGMAGLFSGTILYSLDYTRTRLANDILLKQTNRQFTGIIDVYKQTLKTDGFIGLYRGFFITCANIVLYRGMYFGLYDSMKIIYPNIMNHSYLNRFIVGFIISTTSSIMVYPFDTIRRRMMMTSIGYCKYNGYIHCVKYIISNEGVRSFYKGCGINMLRGFAGAGTLVGFDWFQSLYSQYK